MQNLDSTIEQWVRHNDTNITLPNLIKVCDAIVKTQLSQIQDAESKVIDRINQGDHPLREAIWNVEKNTP